MTVATLLLWMCSLICAVLAVRTRLRAGRQAGAPPGPPAGLRVAAAVPVPRALRALGARPGTDRRIVAAGFGATVSVGLVERARVGAATVGVIVSLVAASVALPMVAVAPPAAAAGFLAPGAWLAGRARTRRERLARELPDLLDLLVISVEAGMSLDPALTLAAERLPGTLAGEVRAMLGRLALGTPRRAAYQGLADAAATPEVERMVGALVQAEELGTPLSRALAGQAEGVRQARRQLARDRAARAAPRIQLVVALLMVPAALVLVMGVLLMELARQVGAVTGAA